MGISGRCEDHEVRKGVNTGLQSGLRLDKRKEWCQRLQVLQEEANINSELQVYRVCETRDKLGYR